MMLTSLALLALSISGTCNTGTCNQSLNNVIGLSSDNFKSFEGNFFFTPTQNVSYTLKVSLNRDSLLNESFEVEFYHSYSNNKTYYEWTSDVLNNYNVSVYFKLTFYELILGTPSYNYFDCPTQYLVGESSFSSFWFESANGAPIDMNLSLDSSKTYACEIDGLIQLVPGLDFDNYLDNSYQDGYNNGYQTGSTEGYQNGYTEGYNQGQSDGYNDGYTAGKTDGYTEGYNVALNTHDFSFTNLFASISDTPVLMIRRMFDFGIFGQSALTILLSLFTCLVVIKILKKVW